MQQNYTLFYLLDNTENYRDIFSPGEFDDFDPELSAFLNTKLNNLEFSPPERLIKNILTEVQP